MNIRKAWYIELYAKVRLMVVVSNCYAGERKKLFDCLFAHRIAILDFLSVYERIKSKNTNAIKTKFLNEVIKCANIYEKYQVVKIMLTRKYISSRISKITKQQK